MHWLHGPGLLNVVEPHQTSFKTIPSLNQNPLSILVQFPLMEKIQEQQQQEEGVRFKRICVLCGTSALGKPSYQLAAVQLGKELVERNIDLVCGGSTGLMGQVAKAVSDGGRNVLEVNLRRNLKPKEITGEPVVEVNGVDAMHQRKAEMACQSDAFIALPGGYGTLEQLLEVITWAQLGIHQKPVGLLNVDGYYDSIISIIDKAVDDGFIGTAARHIVVSAPTAQQLMHDLEVYAPQHSGLVWEKEQLEYTAESDIAR